MVRHFVIHGHLVLLATTVMFLASRSKQHRVYCLLGSRIASFSEMSLTTMADTWSPTNLFYSIFERDFSYSFPLACALGFPIRSAQQARSGL